MYGQTNLENRMCKPMTNPLRTMIIALVSMAVFQISVGALGFENPKQSRKPKNFVFFLVDDLGWADVGCFGSQFHETPNIDSLAATGMRFTQGYAACPVCSPTRASILTGRHPVRVGITDWIPGMDANRVADAKFSHVDDRDNLALKEVTIAEVLKEKGYATFFAGKWHLGDKGHWPTDQGFDINVGGNKKGSPPGGYYAPWKNPTLKARNKGEYLTERLTDESIQFLEDNAAKVDSENKTAKPFLLYLSYYNVHSPITPYKKKIEHFKAKRESTFKTPPTFIEEHDGFSRTQQDNAAYASMVSAVDQSVGAILKKLDELKISDETAVIFFSDNGGLCTLPRKSGPTSNLPLRSGKGWLYEGGIREPMIVRVPGMTPPKSVCDEPVVSMDFFPTMMELAGLPVDDSLHADGRSLVPLLSSHAKTHPARDLHWHYPHYHGSAWKPGAAIRSGNWKLIEFYETEVSELYDLKNDPGESRDLASKFPDQTKRLREKLAAWQERMGAKMPMRR